MEVAFDPAKNESDIKKHGISLQQAEDFDFNSAFYDVDNSQDYGEVRYNAIGWLDSLLHTFTFTRRAKPSARSAFRRATRQEQTIYDQES